jgi:putative DNA-invertase from lambdoid prophage Rac
MKVAIYARVSTLDQHCELQLSELGGMAKRSDWEAFEYVDHVSGKAGIRRPALERLMADARLRKFDIVLCWKLDRFGRSLKEIIERIHTLSALGIRFMAPSQGIDTDTRTPMGQFLIHILGAFAELERSLIQERCSAGLKNYQEAYRAGQIGQERHSKSGKDLPPGRPKKIFRRARAQELRKRYWSWREIARELGVPVSTLRDG